MRSIKLLQRACLGIGIRVGTRARWERGDRYRTGFGSR